MRFPVLPSPPVAPAECVACKRPTDPVGFIDLGVMVELHGALYLCVTYCLTEMARQVGLVRPDGGEERERAARVGAERALASAVSENSQLRGLAGDAVLRLLHEVTLERLRIEMALEATNVTEGGDGDRGADAPGGGDAGGAAGAGGELDDQPPAERDQSLPAASGRPRTRSPRGRPREAAEPAAGADAGRGGAAAVDGAGTAATA